MKEFKSEKILSYDKAKKLINELKKTKTVGLCHGGFDLLHAGHVLHLQSAKELCDVLVVSITSDKFVAKRKGEGRPVYEEQLRAYTVASLEYVDYVVISDFEKGTDVIKELKPSYYIKGPDYINKTTPGITAEREAIKAVGGEMKYTDDPKLSTTEYIKRIQKIDKKKVLLGIDRDGTLIEEPVYLGKEDNWKEEVKLKESVLNYIYKQQMENHVTSIVITNQSGVARKYFDTKKVEEINSYIDNLLKGRGINIDNWQYCPDVDSEYAKKTGSNFDKNFVKDKTKRKPSPDMLLDGLKELNISIEDFDEIIIFGDRHEDRELAKHLKAKFIDANSM